MLSERIPYYILDLLQLTPSVYVEGLGRFEAIFHSAQFDTTRTKIEPPHIEATFNTDENDGNETLEAFIHYTLGDQAGSPKEAIASFVKTVWKQTDDDSAYAVDKFGTFVRSNQGNIRFTPDWDAFNIAFSGLESLELKSIGQQQPSVVPLTPPTPYVPKSTPAEVDTKLEHMQEQEAAEASIAAVDKSKDAFEKNLDRIDQSTTRLWWIILSSAILLIAVLCIYLAWDIMINQNRLNDLKKTLSDTTITVPNNYDTSSVTKSNTDSLPGKTATDNADSVKASGQNIKETDPPCFIVVGAFGDPANVTKMEERLRSLGYVVELFKGRILTKVAIRTSCDQSNLNKVLNDVRSSINPESWIY